jgi:hypothetical protein
VLELAGQRPHLIGREVAGQNGEVVLLLGEVDPDDGEETVEDPPQGEEVTLRRPSRTDPGDEARARGSTEGPAR